MAHADPARRPCRTATALAVATLFLGSLPAQEPSPWNDLTVPGGTVQYGAMAAGKVVLYRAGAFLRVFSAVTRQWHAQALSFGTTPILAKELVLVPESDRWTAFSAWRGTFEAVFVPYATSTMMNSDSIACVTNGNTLHTFSAFTGQWHTRTLPAGWVVGLGNRVALIRTPTIAPNLAASAFDAYTGQWHDLPSQPLGLYGARIAGGALTLSTIQQEYGFSPLRPGWVQAPVPGVPPFPASQSGSYDGDLVPGLRSVFSGLTGTHAALPFATATSWFSVEGNVATVGDGTNSWALGAASNSWVALPSHPWAPASAPDVVLGYGTGVRTAFSPVLDTLATAPGNSAAAGGNLAIVGDATQYRVYSTLTGQWYDAPAGAVPGVHFGENSAVYLSGTGVVGFAAPSGAFVPLPGAGLTIVNGFAALGGGALHAFDARGNRWLSMPHQPGTPFVQSSARVLIATVPGQALGFAVRGRRLVSQALAEPVAERIVMDDVAFVRTANHVHAFSGLAETANWQGDVEGSYDAGIGATVRMQALTPSGHFVAMGFGPALPSPQQLPFGELWLDPAASTAITLAPAPGELRAVVTLAIPNVTALRNTTWLQQAITLAPNGELRLGVPSTLLVQ